MRLQGFSGTKREIRYTGGGLPYLWIGDEKNGAFAVVGTARQARALMRMCQRMLDAYERKEQSDG